MMAFPEMLIDAAEQAGMKVPNLEENEDFDRDEFPHFHVFCLLQLGRPIRWGEHWDNAKVIADIPEDKLKTLDLQGFIDLGLQYSSGGF